MMKYYIVDAFTDRPFGGNPAGVVLLGDEPFPDERLMLQVAAELRYSETAFVRFTHAICLAPQETWPAGAAKVERRTSSLAFPRCSCVDVITNVEQTHFHNLPGSIGDTACDQRGANTFEAHVRYFTPAAEVELCGHATVATFALLHKLGLAEGRCLCHTLAGDLAVEAGEQVLMQMAKPRIVATITDIAPIYQALGLDGYCPGLPVQVAYAGLNDIMIPVPDVATLNTLQPDMEAVAAISQSHGACSFHVFALPTNALTQSGIVGQADGTPHTITAYVRDFAPLCGIPEESATGTANAALTYYLATNKVISVQGDFNYLQGEVMGRPSVVATRIVSDGTVYVGGTAAIVAEGELLTQ